MVTLNWGTLFGPVVTVRLELEHSRDAINC